MAVLASLTTRTAHAEAISYTGAQILDALDASFWIGADKPKPKHVYVLVAPWCPVCKSQHKDLAAQSGDIEFRFVLTAPKSPAERDQLGRVTAARSAAALNAIYTTGPKFAAAALTPAETFASGYNDALWTALNPALQLRSTQTIGFPTFVYASGGKAKVLVGSLGSKETLTAAVDERAAATSGPITPVALKPIEPKPKFAKADGVTLYLAPHTKATRLATIKAGAGYLAKSSVEASGETWFAFQFFANGPPSAFGRASDFR